MRLRSVAALLTATLWARIASAVFADEAWNVDYHYALLGEPMAETTFFHQPSLSSKASLIYTLSGQGVLGAVNPRDGALVWRQRLQRGGSDNNATFLRAGQSQDVIVSGCGSRVAGWTAAEGRLAWDAVFEGPLVDLEILELVESSDVTGSKDTIALLGGEHAAAVRIDGSTGVVKWRHAIDTDAPYQVSTSSTRIFVILLHKTLLGHYKLRVAVLDTVTGKRVDEYTLSSENELTNTETIVTVGANSASPIIAWTDAARTVLKVNVLGSKTIATFSIDKHGDDSVEGINLHAPYHVNSLSHFLVHYQTPSSHWAEVYHIDAKNGRVEKAYSLPKLAGKGAFSTSSVDANVYFTRVTQDEVLTVSSQSHGVLGKWLLQGVKVAVQISDIPAPIHAISEVSVKGDAVSAIRTAVYTSTGDWILVRDGSPVWTRPEILATTVAASFAAPADAEALVQQLKAEAHSNPIAAYSHRLQRHLRDLQKLPDYLLALPQRTVNGFLGTSAEGGLSSDSFGFHQLVVCATANGRLVAFDAGSPSAILWNRQAVELKPGQTWQPMLSSPKGGVIDLRSKAEGTGIQYNTTDGEQIASILPIVEVGETSPKPVRYTVRDGALHASLGESPLWHFSPTGGDSIVSLVPRPINDPVASIGKVLGDRRVLYKYLDPNLALLVTGRNTSRTATFYVLNTVSGAVLYSNIHTNVDLNAPISSIVSENWFAYSLTADSTDDAPKGHQLVVGELFESLVPNDRGPLSSASNYSSLERGTEPFTLVQTYQIPEAISKLAVTQTRQGITSRQLLAVLPGSNAIVGIPYGALDPRRPVGRDPTKEEQMEGLAKYHSVLEFDPKWYLNHQREVVGISDIVTSPALLESTSLVFAYGLDVFGTRLSPSFSFDILGKDFNKFQMLATVAALAVATFVVAPLVTRKQVDQRWTLL